MPAFAISPTALNFWISAWWKMENLKKVIALRVLRANGDWEEYWTNVHQEAA